MQDNLILQTEKQTEQSSQTYTQYNQMQTQLQTHLQIHPQNPIMHPHIQEDNIMRIFHQQTNPL